MSDHQQVAPYAQLQAEIAALKGELQINQLRYDLEKLQAEKSSRLEDSLYSPKLYDHYRNVAEGISKSKMIPVIYQNKPDDIFIAMAYGYQLGFPLEQALQDIAVVNGRPCLWGDGMLAVVMTHKDYEKHSEQPIYNDENLDDCVGYQCTIWRKGQQPHVVEYTKADAEKAGLWSKPGAWKTNPKRMLQLRARAFALRDKFADALRGVRQAEVERDEPVDITPGESKNFLEAIQSKKGQSKPNTPKKEEPTQPKKPDGNTNDQTKPAPEPAKTEKPPVFNAGRDDLPINDEQQDLIYGMIKEKEMPKERLTKALAYFKVDCIESMTDAQARLFILQLDKL